MTVNCIDALGIAYAVRADRMIRYELDTSSEELLLSSPGFNALNNALPPFPAVLAASTPFAFPTTVPVTVGAHSLCAVGTAVAIEYFDPARAVGSAPMPDRADADRPRRGRRRGASICASSPTLRASSAATPASPCTASMPAATRWR